MRQHVDVERSGWLGAGAIGIGVVSVLWFINLGLTASGQSAHHAAGGDAGDGSASFAVAVFVALALPIAYRMCRRTRRTLPVGA
jgi:hypothetical protein